MMFYGEVGSVHRGTMATNCSFFLRTAAQGHDNCTTSAGGPAPRGHANLLCIVPILTYVLPKQAHSMGAPAT